MAAVFDFRSNDFNYVWSAKRPESTGRPDTAYKSKEGYDQESIKLPNIFRSKHQRERRTFLTQRHHNQNTTSRKPKGQFLSQKDGQMAIQNENCTRTYMQRHTMTEIVNHTKSTTLERSVKYVGKGRWDVGGAYINFTWPQPSQSFQSIDPGL